jgi:D-alanine-D-alanine ligase-like ATP-grasp enzyme
MAIFASKKLCVDCGKNQVPHFLYWYFESLNILFGPIRRFFLNRQFFQFVIKVFSKLRVGARLVIFGQTLGLLRLSADINQCKVSRAKVLWAEATARGINMQELLLLGKPFDTYIAQKTEFSIFSSQFLKKAKNQNDKLNKNNTLIFSGLPRPASYNNSALDWMDDKWLLKQKFISENLPVPLGGSVLTFKQAVKIFNQIKKPVIVKPRAGSRGRHTSIFVHTPEQLKVAVASAKKLCAWVMVEEQLSGPIYRATVINYELCGVLRGDPPQVEGNGQSTIFELAEQKNTTALPPLKPISLDGNTERFLNLQGWSFSSVLPLGQRVNLSEKIGVNYGGSAKEELELCHPDTRALFVQSAKVLHEPIVGFDFIIPEITQTYKTQKCGFIEANSLPFINLHHTPLLGEPQNVAKKVWDMVGM